MKTTAINWKVSYLLILFMVCSISLPAFSPVAIPSLTTNTAGPMENHHEDPKPNKLISFAKGLLGVHYKYGATHPSRGFDCSGFVYYVFKKFDIDIPRSSAAIGKVGSDIQLSDARAGDIILFTGTNPARRSIGHVGIVLSNSSTEGLEFIHASSGKANAVTETKLEGSYKRRYMKIVRVI